jgi:hypothetical protein
MILLVDDMRDIKGADIIVRNFEAAKMLLQNMDFDQLWLDHDLGETEENGYTLLKWCFYYHYFPAKTIQLVTANPVGYVNMENLLLSHGYEKVGSCTYSYKG